MLVKIGENYLKLKSIQKYRATYINILNTLTIFIQ